MVSKFAFKVNLYRYNKVERARMHSQIIELDFYSKLNVKLMVGFCTS
jgi:hypothetical protein